MFADDRLPHLTRALRLLMIVQNCPYVQDTRVRQQAKALKAAGYRVSVICPRQTGTTSFRSLEGINLYQFPVVKIGGGVFAYLLEYLSSALAIALLTALVALREGFDVIHVANPPDWIVLELCVYQLFGKMIIYDQHDLCPELYKAKFPSANTLLCRLQILLERISYRRADHVIVTNESYRRIAIQRGNLPESSITIVRNGPPLSKVTDAQVDGSIRMRSANLIAFAGVTGDQDGLDYLCRALRVLRYELGREDFCCIVMGDGDALERIKATAREMQLTNHMWFTGWISNPKLYARYLATADICVSPEPSNPYNDCSTFIKVLEYMAAGKPIVAFDLPESHYSAGEAALYAKSNDPRDFASKIAVLMDDSGLRTLMGTVAKRRIEDTLAWEYSVGPLLAVYARLTTAGQRNWNPSAV